MSPSRAEVKKSYASCSAVYMHVQQQREHNYIHVQVLLTQKTTLYLLIHVHCVCAYLFYDLNSSLTQQFPPTECRYGG